MNKHDEYSYEASNIPLKVCPSNMCGMCDYTGRYLRALTCSKHVCTLVHCEIADVKLWNVIKRLNNSMLSFIKLLTPFFIINL